MKRCIYSIYVPLQNYRNKFEPFQKYYSKIINAHTQYADSINVDYRLCKTLPTALFHTPTYDQINFGKYLYAKELCKEYDEVLYIDFDVIPNTKENFFDKHDMSTICIADQGEKKYDIVPNHPLDNRSPLSKYWNTHAMCSTKEYDVPTGVFNTAIIGGNKTVATRLKYFDNFENVLNDMVRCKADEMYTPNIRAGFGFDNETVFGYRVQQNDVPITYLDESWHYKLEDRSPVAFEQAFQKAKLIHMMNKRFELYYEDIDNGK